MPSRSHVWRIAGGFDHANLAKINDWQKAMTKLSAIGSIVLIDRQDRKRLDRKPNQAFLHDI